MSKTVAEILYDQAVRGIEHQVRELDEIRSRTAIVLAAGGVTAGFLGRAAFDKGIGAFGICAIFLFGVSACSAIWVLLPRWDSWTFEIGVRALQNDIESGVVGDGGDEAVYSYLAKWLEHYFDQNATLLEGLYKWFTVACAFLAADILVWFAALGLD